MEDIRQQILHLIKHLEHVLPAQAPIKDFVHHNTLHGYQHLHFTEALAQSEKTSGAKGYLSNEQFRQLFTQDRINTDDLNTVLKEDSELQLESVIVKLSDKQVTHGDIILNALLHPLKAITHCQLTWQIEELSALERFQSDLSTQQCQALIQRAAQLNSQQSNEKDTISALWQATLKTLDLEHLLLHPEDMVDMSADQAESMLSEQSSDEVAMDNNSLTHRQAQKESRQLLGQLLDSVGHKITLGGFIKAMTGVDILDDIRPVLLRHIASYLDQGMAAWHQKDKESGFYQSWKNSAHEDLAWIFEGLDDWIDHLEGLPDDPMDTIIQELRRQGIAQDRWTGYLERLALELPGWSGMFLWRDDHPHYNGLTNPVNMLDYLAVRLILEHIFAQRVCSEYWRIEANLDTLKYYFRRRTSNFLVRYTLYNERLPEYLTTLSAHQIERAKTDYSDYTPWKKLSNMIWTWQHSPVGSRASGYRVSEHAWPLFRLFQYLGLTAQDVAQIEAPQIKQIFTIITSMEGEKSSFIWLQAYEHHYHEIYFNTLANNEGRGRWKERKDRPDAQLIFCMDDREEGIRRHLEELNPNIETLGAAAHFGVPHNWRGLDDNDVTALTPVVFVPTHEFKEVIHKGQEDELARHQQKRNWRLQAKALVHQETRRNLLSSAVLIALSAPAALLTLAAKVFAPGKTGALADFLRSQFEADIPPSSVAINCRHPLEEPTPEDQQQGYTDDEQVDKIETFLRLIGLTSGFSPFVVIVGHGSISQNNPHLAAYDCGACSGRHSGPNARIQATIANRPEIRKRLKERGLDIPDDTWFLGSEHNTCDEKFTWYDTEAIPHKQQAAFEKMKREVYEASQWSAHERCRRLASAPENPSKEEALEHIISRSYDFSQARPELGHATNAICFIGRRSATQGAFFDRRIFLISYDPETDPEGIILEKLLLANGPVGAGISLEYYFSTVDNERYGSGSKITHNVNGLFGVMDGGSGDLRTGLPRQMIEIHEAMRLQIVVEHSIDVLTRIYTAQPALQELIGNGWILLSNKDPDSKNITQFKPDRGFVPWQGNYEKLDEFEASSQWYSGHSEALNLALIKQPEGDHVRGRQGAVNSHETRAGDNG
ncbi:MAG: DUF2309 domain-containing protein [gamma proteobacterium symbiont of Taylorina sp.]|nr:DUF2309 domain-containing protein [gamma proteobacterium symbiont of Taylorina sp.]